MLTFFDKPTPRRHFNSRFAKSALNDPLFKRKLPLRPNSLRRVTGLVKYVVKKLISVHGSRFFHKDAFRCQLALAVLNRGIGALQTLHRIYPGERAVQDQRY